MNILLVITSLGGGGAERLVVNLADSYSALGHKVAIAYFINGVVVKPKDDKVDLIYLKGSYSLGGMIRGAINLRKLIVKIKPDVINSHMFHPNLICRILRLFTTMKYLVSSAHSPHEGGGIRIPLYRYTDKLTNISTNVSEEAVDSMVSLKAVNKSRMVTICNGVDTELFRYNKEYRKDIRKSLNIPVHKKVLLAVGRFSESKDYPTLIQAMVQLSILEDPPLLLISGDGPLRLKIESYTKCLGISDKVQFLGFRSDVHKIMSACDIFVLSSSSEGFGLVVAEAMSSERMVVATDCGGVKEVIGDTGSLVPTRSPNLLAEALAEALLYTPDDFNCIGLKARKRIIEKYSIETTANNYLKVYKL